MDLTHLASVCLSQSPMFDGKVPHWHHFSCFWLRAAVQSPSDISGFTDLRWGDQEKVKTAIESGGATGGDLLIFLLNFVDFSIRAAKQLGLSH